MRFLMMFGPMIYRQYNKYMANKNRNKQNAHANQQGQIEGQNNSNRPEVKEDDYV